MMPIMASWATVTLNLLGLDMRASFDAGQGASRASARVTPGTETWPFGEANFVDSSHHVILRSARSCTPQRSAMQVMSSIPRPDSELTPWLRSVGRARVSGS